MAPNDRSNIHNDAYSSGAYVGSGPLGRNVAVSSTFFLRECGSVMFDSQGRIVTICVGLDRPVLALIDPTSLTTLAALPLPIRNLASLGNIFSDFSGGGYFYLDHNDHAVYPTSERHIQEAAVVDGPGGPLGFSVIRDIDLTGVIPSGEGIVSVLPDWSNRLWFVTRRGIVGTIDRGSGAVQTINLGEGISNSFVVDETGGVFIVSDKALYRFDAGPSGQPSVSWREVYPNSGIHKPSQSDAGSGTTPDLIGRDLIAITDNADPMDVVVYRRSRQAPAGPRQACVQPVFRAGRSATDNSLISTADSVVVENNYGYSGPLSTQFGGVTEPGIAKVEINARAVQDPALQQPSGQQPYGSPKAKKRKKKKKKASKKRKAKRKKKGKKRKKRKKRKRKPASTPAASVPAESLPPGRIEYGCRVAWESPERAPSVVPKLSLANGLVYTYAKPEQANDADAWYLTALDFSSGETVYRRLAGYALGFNNNYAPVTLGPDGAAYVGVLGGLVRLADG